MLNEKILPIPLRGEQCVFVANIPWDLTADEALRIAAVIEAMASDEPLSGSPVRHAEPLSDDYVKGFRAGRKLAQRKAPPLNRSQ